MSIREDRINKADDNYVTYEELKKYIEELKEEGHSVKEIAVHCGLNESSVRVYLKN